MLPEMSFDNLYLERYASKKKLIGESPGNQLGLCVIIPSFNEPELFQTLQSLASCDSPDTEVEIIVVINHSHNADRDIVYSSIRTFNETRHWAHTFSTKEIRYHIVYVPNTNPKHAGVGLARKIGMDEAVRRLESVGNSNGVIVCLDADSLVDKNYLIAIWEHFINNPNVPGCSIYFEHPHSGNLDKAHDDRLLPHLYAADDPALAHVEHRDRVAARIVDDAPATVRAHGDRERARADALVDSRGDL